MRSATNHALESPSPARMIVNSLRKRPNGGDPTIARAPNSSAPPTSGAALITPPRSAAIRVR